MRLTPKEIEKLLLHCAGELAKDSHLTALPQIPLFLHRQSYGLKVQALPVS